MRIGIVLAITIAAAVDMPLAHADTTLTQADWCNRSGTVPVIAPFQNFTVCAKPGTVPGLFVALPQAINRAIPQQFQGAYPVDIGNAFSDWIIPDGAQPAPPTPDPQIACDNIGPNRSIVCNHEIWLKVMNAG